MSKVRFEFSPSGRGPSRRSVLVLAGAGIASAGLAAAATLAAPAVRLPALRRPGDADDSAALLRALDAGRPVHLPAGEGSAADGAYVIGSGGLRDNLRAGVHLSGDGPGRTIVRPPPAQQGFIFFCDSGSADPARNLGGIRLSGFTLADDVVRLGFAEHRHLAHLNGVSDLLIEHVEFRGFRGDGLYLGSGPGVADERHNRRVLLRRCRFDGVNANNRNAISIIDGDDVAIEDTDFVNCTRPGYPIDATPTHPRWRADPFDPDSGLPMPGCVNCEPNAEGFPVLRNIRVERCRFRGGGGAAVALLLKPNHRLRVPHRDFLIRDCEIDGRRFGFAFSGFGGRDAIEQPHDYAVLFERNRVTDVESPFLINGARGLTMRNNRFAGSARAAELGYSSYNHAVVLAGNDFVRLGEGRHGINGLIVRFADTVRLAGNRFVDCGRADGSGGRAISFVAGDIARFELLDNRFESPTGRTTYAIGVNGANLDRRTSRAAGNIFAFQTNRDFG